VAAMNAPARPTWLHALIVIAGVLPATLLVLTGWLFVFVALFLRDAQRTYAETVYTHMVDLAAVLVGAQRLRVTPTRTTRASQATRRPKPASAKKSVHAV
jgi:hypothetical protein